MLKITVERLACAQQKSDYLCYNAAKVASLPDVLGYLWPSLWSWCGAKIAGDHSQDMNHLDFRHIKRAVAGFTRSFGEYGLMQPLDDVLPSGMEVERDADGNVLAQPFTHDEDNDKLFEGTVSGGSPCKSILEVLLSERLDTTRAVLQVRLAYLPCTESPKLQKCLNQL